MARPSRIDDRLTIHPIEGHQVCGALKQGARWKMEQANMSMEDLIELGKTDIEQYKELVCCARPLRKEGWNNGRCKKHGAKAGRPITSGKYTTKLGVVTAEEVEKINKKGHLDLNEELSILSKLIGDKLEEAFNEDEDSSPLANDEMQRHIDRLAKYMDQANFKAMRETVEKMNDMCVNQRAREKAKQETALLLKQYADIFNVEIKNRIATGEYVPKSVVVNDYRMLFMTVSEFIPKEHVETVRQKLSRYLINDSGFGTKSLDPTNS